MFIVCLRMMEEGAQESRKTQENDMYKWKQIYKNSFSKVSLFYIITIDPKLNMCIFFPLLFEDY
jgi:hypothetical protein